MTGRKLITEADAALARLAIADDLEYVAASLELLTVRTGDKRYRHAAAVLRGRVGGRPQVDDTEALAEIEHLVSAGKPLDVALGIVARRMAPTNPDSVARRLRKKIGRNGSGRPEVGVQSNHD